MKKRAVLLFNINSDYAPVKAGYCGNQRQFLWLVASQQHESGKGMEEGCMCFPPSVAYTNEI